MTKKGEVKGKKRKHETNGTHPSSEDTASAGVDEGGDAAVVETEKASVELLMVLLLLAAFEVDLANLDPRLESFGGGRTWRQVDRGP